MQEPRPTPPRTMAAIFRMGDVCLKIWKFETVPPRFMVSLEKLIDPAILKEAPALAYTFTPTDVSAIRKLTREAEDALFNFQSALLRPVDPTTDQGRAPSEAPPAPPPAPTADDTEGGAEETESE